MRAVIQRVTKASVSVESKVVGEINKGLFILIGIEIHDKAADADLLADKISKIRILSDKNDKMNLSVLDLNAPILVVSQFTLHASTNKGNRPSFINAAEPENAQLMEDFGLRGHPSFAIVARDGRLAQTFFGPQTEKSLRSAILEIFP